MEWINVYVGLLLTNLLLVLVDSAVLRPAVFWDPYHVLFSCDDPTIYVKLNDKLLFICQSNELTSNPQLHGGLLYESAYLLDSDQEEDYQNCNATNHLSELLKCDGTYKTRSLTFSAELFQYGAIQFTAGKTYFVIGTGFRKKDKANQLVGGSCNETENSKQYKLRLKIHIITNETVNPRLCETEACYYKDCGYECSQWSNVSSSINGSTMFLMQKRTCSNNLLQNIKEEYREQKLALCPSSINPSEYCKNCTDWTELATSQKESYCLSIQKRDCWNYIRKESSQELRELVVACTHGPVTAPKHGQDECNISIYKYLLAILSLVFVMIGTVFGALIYKKYHQKTCGGKNSNVFHENGIQYNKGNDNPMFLKEG